MLHFPTENGSPNDFPSSVHRLLIVKTEVCRLSVFSRRNKTEVIRLQRDLPIFSMLTTVPYCDVFAEHIYRADHRY